MAQVHGRVTVVALAAPSPVDWDEKKERIKTVDDAPGADLQWDEKTGRVRVCDREADGHLARGEVSAGELCCWKIETCEQRERVVVTKRGFRTTTPIKILFQSLLGQKR